MDEPGVGGMVRRLYDAGRRRVSAIASSASRHSTSRRSSILFSRSLGKRDRSSEDNLHRAIHHVNLAHGAAVDVLREKVPGASIGCIHNFQPCWPVQRERGRRGGGRAPGYLLEQGLPRSAMSRRISITHAACHRAAHPARRLARICRPVDWFGLNHYSPVYVRRRRASMLGFDFGEKPAGVPLTPIGWPINPEAFSETLRTVHQELRFADLRS